MYMSRLNDAETLECQAYGGRVERKMIFSRLCTMDGDEDSSPFTTRQFAAIISGIHTEFFLSGYENRYFIVISQLGKLGTLVRKDLPLFDSKRAHF